MGSNKHLPIVTQHQIVGRQHNEIRYEGKNLRRQQGKSPRLSLIEGYDFRVTSCRIEKERERVAKERIRGTSVREHRVRADFVGVRGNFLSFDLLFPSSAFGSVPFLAGDATALFYTSFESRTRCWEGIIALKAKKKNTCLVFSLVRQMIQAAIATRDFD